MGQLVNLTFAVRFSVVLCDGRWPATDVDR